MDLGFSLYKTPRNVKHAVFLVICQDVLCAFQSVSKVVRLCCSSTVRSSSSVPAEL